MKIKIRQHDASMPQDDGSSQMGDWLAELGDDNHTKPPGDGHAEPDGTDDPWLEVLAQVDARVQAPEQAATTPAAVMTTCLETGPDQLAITPGPAPVEPPPATPRNQPRPLEVAQCSMCGIALPLGLLVPDGGQACADIRWYCKDAMSCTKRWTAAHTPGRAHMPAARDDAFAGAGEAAPDSGRRSGWSAHPKRYSPHVSGTRRARGSQGAHLRIPGNGFRRVAAGANNAPVLA